LINGYGRYLRTRRSHQPTILHDLPPSTELSEDDDPF
jgi:hypothetical protein